MAIKQKLLDDVAIIIVSGKLMGGNETKKMHETVKEITDKGHKKIIIDLSAVKWMNSQGLGILISCLTTIKNANAILKIAGATDKVNSLFMITKLITVFDCYETVGHGIANFK